MNVKNEKVQALRHSSSQCRINRKRAETKKEKVYWTHKQAQYENEIKNIVSGL